MWDKMQWGIFFIFTGFLIPLGIVFIIMARRENNELPEWNYKTFINSYISKDRYEQRYF